MCSCWIHKMCIESVFTFDTLTFSKFNPFWAVGLAQCTDLMVPHEVSNLYFWYMGSVLLQDRLNLGIKYELFVPFFII